MLILTSLGKTYPYLIILPDQFCGYYLLIFKKVNMIKSQFVDIIETTTPNPNLLMWKFEDKDKEIKNGAKLIVRESQIAIFLNQGILADVFLPGTHTLSTENIPILSKLKGWKYGFQSPFKADIYFVNTRQFVNNKWGTPTPIIMRDPEFGQVRVRAFGTFDIQINNFDMFFRHYAGSYETFDIFELQYELRDFIAPQFGEVLAQQNISIKDITANLTTIGKQITPGLKPYFEQFGIQLITFVITGVTLPDEVSAHYDQITNMNMVSDMDKFTKFTTAQAIAQPSTVANQGVTEGIISAMVTNQVLQQNKNSVPDTNQGDIASRLKKLKSLFENELITQEEYQLKRTELIDKL